MKIQIVFLFIVLGLSTSKKLKKNTKKSQAIPRKISPHFFLPSTPKGDTLTDHFGGHATNSNYGPQPTLVRQHIKDYTDINGNHFPELVISKVVHAPIGYAESCDIHEINNYELCLAIKDCDFCTANPYCGWCGGTGKCYPGNMEYASCPQSCVNGWVFGERMCTDKIRAGSFSNIAPEATGFITPESASKKFFVTSVIHHPAVVKTPVLLGVRDEEHIIEKKNSFTGEIVSHHSTHKTVPIVGEMHQMMDVATQHQQYIDAKTGKRLDQIEERVHHGTSVYRR